jgi:hypothetical protein
MEAMRRGIETQYNLLIFSYYVKKKLFSYPLFELYLEKVKAYHPKTYKYNIKNCSPNFIILNHNLIFYRKRIANTFIIIIIIIGLY